VVPAAARFEPAQAAARLSGASAADFPPISPRGWAWRAIPATVLSLAVIVAIGLGLASIGSHATAGTASASSDAGSGATEDGASDEDVAPAPAESEPEPEAEAEPEPSSDTTFERSTFTFTLPASWKGEDRDKPYYEDSGELSYVQSTWHPSYDPVTEMKVDYTENVDASAPRSAHDLREQYYLGRSAYQEIDWSPATIGGHSAWRWEFIWLKRHKVDYFVKSDCGIGYAVLGSTTLGNWDKYDGLFERATHTLEPSC
jgi:hypothetical protein